MIALIVIPPEQLPSVIQTVGKVLRELRSASNELMREIADSVEEGPATTASSARSTTPPEPPAESPAKDDQARATFRTQ